MKKRRKSAAEESVVTGYDYSTREAREETVSALFARARSARSAVEQEWTRYNDYYNFIHDTTALLARSAEEGENLCTAVVPDPWIIVESQVDPHVPQPLFRGRDSEGDDGCAREREYVVRYICENNRLADMNTRNERRLLKYGDAFWKAYWDAEMPCGAEEGDIRIRDVPVDAVYPDPAVRDGTIQDGQYLDYIYRVHKVRFVQMFGETLAEADAAAEELTGRDGGRGELFAMDDALCETDDTVQILEHWFRQPADTEEDGRFVPAGSVACSIQAGGRELRYIPDYWRRTHRQCKLFPFVHYWRVQDENQIWNKSELFPVLDLVDAADRKLSMGVLGDALLSNDIILAEEGALSEGQQFTNEPGAVIHVKPNRINAVRRLGGIQSMANAAVGLEWYKDEIERSTRNYETSRGKETRRTDTASGLAMLRSDAESQADIKRADRNRGFERLYELLDCLALEFYDEDRMIYLGADEEQGREKVSFVFNADRCARTVGSGEGRWRYFPRVDVSITAVDSVMQGKQATLETLERLSGSSVTAENWKLFAAQLDLLNLPGRQEIIEDWSRRFAEAAPPAEAAERGETEEIHDI